MNDPWTGKSCHVTLKDMWHRVRPATFYDVLRPNSLSFEVSLRDFIDLHIADMSEGAPPPRRSKLAMLIAFGSAAHETSGPRLG
jgi:hypothetical protein